MSKISIDEGVTEVVAWLQGNGWQVAGGEDGGQPGSTGPTIRMLIDPDNMAHDTRALTHQLKAKGITLARLHCGLPMLVVRWMPEWECATLRLYNVVDEDADWTATPDAGSHTQPPPTEQPASEPVWPLYRMIHPNCGLWEDIDARNAMGIKRYGMALSTHNGRDAVQDAYEESLDLMAYLTQKAFECPGTRSGFLFHVARVRQTAHFLRVFMAIGDEHSRPLIYPYTPTDRNAG